jgi:hypothetical protein
MYIVDNTSQKLSKSTSKLIVKKEDQNRRGYRAGIFYAAQPQKFLNPMVAYRIEHDYCLIEENQKIYSSMAVINMVKSVNRVDFHKPNEYVALMFEDNKSFPKTSLEYLIERLKSYGDQTCYEWADLIETHFNNYQSKFQEIYKMAKNLKTPRTSAIQEEQIVQSKPGFWLKCKYDKNQRQLLSLKFNTRLIMMLGYELEDFVTKIFVEGSPKIHYLDDQEHAKEKALYYIKNLLEFRLDSMAFPPRATNMLDSQDNLVPVLEEFYPFYNIDEDTEEIFVTHFFGIELNTDAMKVETAVDKTRVEDVNYIRISRDRKVEKDEFLRRFYCKGDDEDLIQKKVCRVRLLNPNLLA